MFSTFGFRMIYYLKNIMDCTRSDLTNLSSYLVEKFIPKLRSIIYESVKLHNRKEKSITSETAKMQTSGTGQSALLLCNVVGIS